MTRFLLVSVGIMLEIQAKGKCTEELDVQKLRHAAMKRNSQAERALKVVLNPAPRPLPSDFNPPAAIQKKKNGGGHRRHHPERLTVADQEAEAEVEAAKRVKRLKQRALEFNPVLLSSSNNPIGSAGFFCQGFNPNTLADPSFVTPTVAPRWAPKCSDS